MSGILMFSRSSTFFLVIGLLPCACLVGCGSDAFDRAAHARSVSVDETGLVGYWQSTLDSYRPKAIEMFMDEMADLDPQIARSIDPKTVGEKVTADEAPGFKLFDDGTFQTVWGDDPFAIYGTWARSDEQLILTAITPDWGGTTFRITDAELTATASKDDGLADIFADLELERATMP